MRQSSDSSVFSLHVLTRSFRYFCPFKPSANSFRPSLAGSDDDSEADDGVEGVEGVEAGDAGMDITWSFADVM